MILKKCVQFYMVLSFGISFALAQWRPDIRIKIFAEENRKGDQELASVGNCLSLEQPSYLRPRVPTVNSIEFTLGVKCLRFYEQQCCAGGRFIDFDATEESDAAPLLRRTHTNLAEDSNWFDPKSVGPCISNSSLLGSVRFPDYLVEPNTTPEQALRDSTNVKRFDDENVAVYISYEQELGNDVNWLYGIFSLGWNYVKTNYGDFGPDGKLYGIYHGDDHNNDQTESRAYLYKSSQSNCRNVISVFSSQKSTGSARSGDKSELDAITLRMSAIVDHIYNGTQGSPNGHLWTWNQAWGDIFRYDLYLKLGMRQDANRHAVRASRRISDTPNPRSTWFRDWFKPMYHKYNGTQSLVRFFQLRDQFFPKKAYSSYGSYFLRNMDVGEYVHFTSGAVDANLWAEAVYAFNLYGNQRKWKQQFDDAQRRFPEIRYKDFDKYK